MIVQGNAEFLENIKRPLMFAAEQAISCLTIVKNYMRVPEQGDHAKTVF